MELTSLNNKYGETITKFMSECSLETFANFDLVYSYNFPQILLQWKQGEHLL